ncbi:MAG: L-seryl-tRNA(Sec) selenium transferase, partial [Deltaproteobacteria bacterium]|nr:L-seryl-tRNA(Sec) selenium transferase [Deltaproteobacteria bacterium]
MTNPDDKLALLRRLPAVHRLAADPAWPASVPDPVRTTAARQVVAELRAAIDAGQAADAAALEALQLAALHRHIQAVDRASMRPILNGSGVLLHTHLGRAPLPPQAVQALADCAGGYTTLELDAETGGRGSRQDHCRPLLCQLSGAEDALVLNNGAAAIFLALRTLARGRPVLVSRGELVEIGGGFRVPDILEASGAELVEVGTTNHTRVGDYRAALQRLASGGRTAAAILRVHRSNFALVGFASSPELGELADLAREHQLPLLVDLGSGALAPLPIRPQPLPGQPHLGEPTVAEHIRQGADLVTFSGDKLVGGPQAGLLVGRRDLVQRLAADPLARALRPGSLTIVALEAVLRMHWLGESANLPVLAACHEAEGQVAERAERWAAVLRTQLGERFVVQVEVAQAFVGGGTHPLLSLPS